MSGPDEGADAVPNRAGGHFCDRLGQLLGGRDLMPATVDDLGETEDGVVLATQLRADSEALAEVKMGPGGVGGKVAKAGE